MPMVSRQTNLTIEIRLETFIRVLQTDIREPVYYD